MEGHGIAKFRDASLLAASSHRPWTLLSAELRRHGAGQIDAFVPQNAEITQIIQDVNEAVSTRASGGVRQEVAARPGTTWLCPAGIREEATRLSADIPQVLHVYIPPHSFLAGELATLDFRAQDLRYQARVDNPRIMAILAAITQELRCESASGGLRMDALAIDLISTLAAGHGETPRANPPTTLIGGLDRRRMDRTLAFMNEHLDRDLSLADLAEAAGVSVFHFSRAFHRTTGLAPHAYLSRRRLDLAKRLLAAGSTGLAEIALTCRFSGQANFTRAFTRAVGMSPGRYRNEVRTL